MVVAISDIRSWPASQKELEAAGVGLLARLHKDSPVRNGTLGTLNEAAEKALVTTPNGLFARCYKECL